MRKTNLIMSFLGAALVANIAWAESNEAVDHSTMDHSTMGHGAPAADGPWSYTSRDNPEPHKQGRWEMVPVPQYGHMFVRTEQLNTGLGCAALRDNPGVMVDRATRKACGMPELPASVANKPSGQAVDHKAMGH